MGQNLCTWTILHQLELFLCGFVKVAKTTFVALLKTTFGRHLCHSAVSSGRVPVGRTGWRTVSTYLALIGLLAGVDTPVSPQVPALDEHFPAELARKWPLARVEPLVVLRQKK